MRYWLVALSHQNFSDQWNAAVLNVNFVEGEHQADPYVQLIFTFLKLLFKK